MNITRVTRIGPGCMIDTDAGRYANWPGRTLPSGLPWWSFTPAGGHAPVLVTGPGIITVLERERSQTVHPSTQLPRPRLTVVRDDDWSNPRGIERPA